MHEISKFKVFTVAFLLTFVFVIAAIYTNTKEVAENKINEANAINKLQMHNVFDERTRVINDEKNQVNDLASRVDILEQRLNEMSINNQNKTSSLNCRIKGVMDNETVVPMSGSEALQDAKYNGSAIVITCEY